MNFFLSFSVICVVFLSGVVIFKSIKNNIGGLVHNPSNPVQWWPQDFGGLLTAIAISGLTFSCHFNILPMHGELQHQTRANKRIILYTAMVITYVLNVLVSFFGVFQVRQVKLWNWNWKLYTRMKDWVTFYKILLSTIHRERPLKKNWMLSTMVMQNILELLFLVLNFRTLFITFWTHSGQKIWPLA